MTGQGGQARAGTPSVESATKKLVPAGRTALVWWGSIVCLLGIVLVAIVTYVVLRPDARANERFPWLEGVLANLLVAFILLLFPLLLRDKLVAWYEDVKQRVERAEIAASVAEHLRPVLAERTAEDRETVLREVREAVESALAGTFPIEYAGIGFCDSQRHCVSQLRRLGANGYAALSKEYPNGNLIHSFLMDRLKILADQLGSFKTDARWNVHVMQEAIAYSPTDADLTYSLVSKQVLNPAKQPWISASTIFTYLPWWLTPPGLHYLEKQRDCDTERIFVFSEPVLYQLFPDLSSPHRKMEGDAGGLFEEENASYLPLAKRVLALHWYLNIAVRVLSPKMADEDEKLRSEVGRWSKKDIAIFGQGERKSTSALCAIELSAGDSPPSPTLSCLGGMLTFEPSLLCGTYKSMRDAAFHIDDNVATQHMAPELDLLKDVLGYPVEKRGQPIPNRRKLTSLQVQTAIRNKIQV
jgi:hypothetical protein